MRPFEQRNRLRGLARAKKTHALHLHGFEILWVLVNSFCEGRRGFGHLALLIEHHASEIFDTRRFWLFRSQGIQFLQCFIQVGRFDQIFGLTQRRSGIVA